MSTSTDARLLGVDTFPAVLFVASSTGQTLWVNRRWYELTGVSDDAALSDAWLESVHPEDRLSVQAEWRRARESGDAFSVAARMRYADGRYVWQHTFSQPLKDERGETVQWAGVVTEIDDLKMVESELLKSELRFRALTDNIPQIIFIADARWNVTYVNRRYPEYTGISEEALRGSGWQQGIPRSELTAIESALREAETRGVLLVENRLYHAPSRSYRWNRVRAERFADSTGANQEWIGSITDIHDQKMALEQKNSALDAFQLALLPRKIAPVPNCDISTMYVSASDGVRVGGDWYDVFELGEDRYGVSIGDVVGHGLDASAAMSRIRQYISAVAEDDSDPASVIRRTNAFIIRRQLPLATALFGVLDMKYRRFTFCSAGHPPPVIAEKERVEFAPCDGVMLGSQRSPIYRSCALDLSDTELFVLYTDGVVEFSRDLLTAERHLLVAAGVAARLRSPASRAAQIVTRTLGSHQARDDIAMIALSFGELGQGSVSHRVDDLMSWQYQSADALSARRVRDQALQFLRELADPNQELFEVKAVLGELIANAAEHAPGPVHVEIDWREERPLLRMRDHGRGFTANAALPGDMMSESGRGLFLIAALADELRATSHFEGGTEVSVRLRLQKNAR